MLVEGVVVAGMGMYECVWDRVVKRGETIDRSGSKEKWENWREKASYVDQRRRICSYRSK